LIGKILASLWLAAAAVGPLLAADPPLSWDDAARIAREKNPSLRSARLAVDSARSAVRASRSGFFPALSADASHSRSDAADDGPGPANSSSLALTLRQSLFSGLGTRADVKAAEARLVSAQAALDAAEAQTAADLRTAFINLLTAQENLSLLRKIRARREDNAKLIQLRFEAGRENRGAALRAQAQLAQARFETDRAGRALETARASLARTLALDSSDALAATGTFRVEVSSAEPGFAALSRQVPDYRKQLAALDEARAGVARARSGFFPEISASLSGRRTGGDWAPATDGWSAGAALSYDLFSGGDTWFGWRRARTEAQRSELALEDLRRQLEVSLRQAFYDLLDAAGAAGVQELFLVASEERAQIARAQYTTGLLSFQDWDLIETDLINAQKQTLTARRDAAAAEAAWRRAQGRGF
jgi:outer membrane protein TolC